MEDFLIRAPNLCTVGDGTTAPPLQLYAVLDGHGGAEVARYSTIRLRTHLEGLNLGPETLADVPTASPKVTCSRCQLDHPPSSPRHSYSPLGIPSLTSPHATKSEPKHPVECALINTFEEIDRELSTHSTLADTSNWQGTTATAVIVGPKQFWLAHVGTCPSDHRTTLAPALVIVNGWSVRP
jgi:serine/threonine protein phosphatase PrpC